MKYISKSCLIALFWALWPSDSHAQNYKPANQKLITEADSLAAIYELTGDSSSRGAALGIYLDLVKDEKKTDHPDTQAIIHSEFQIGYIDMKWGQYRWGMQAFERMMNYVQRPRDRETINKAIPYLGYC
jgi:hypothetical protein